MEQCYKEIDCTNLRELLILVTELIYDVAVKISKTEWKWKQDEKTWKKLLMLLKAYQIQINEIYILLCIKELEKQK